MASESNSFFSFNKTERNGIIVVAVIIILSIIIPRFFHTKQSDNSEAFNQYLADIEKFENSLLAANDSINEARELNFQQMDQSVAANRLKPFVFNPNNLPSEQWSRLGLKDWQIKMIKKYEAAGGRFAKKEDFKKMYCISLSEYEILEPYISIPVTAEVSIPVKPEIVNTSSRQIIDLNTADSVALVTLNGIGPSFARRIIKFRNLLGGFYSKNQLLEVYGFDQARLDGVYNYCSVSLNNIKKININKVKTDELKKHPYFDYYTAKAIVDQRVILGRYTSLQQIKDIPLIHEDLFNKIKNYLQVE